MRHFKEFNLPSILEKTVLEMNLETPTPLQAKSIPVALTHRDLFGCAPSGTGRNVAFCLPLVTRLIKVPHKSALILVPSHELGVQTLEVLKKTVSSCLEMNIALVTENTEAQNFQGQSKPRIVVATPAKLVELLKRGALSLSSTEVLVLNEADRMLEKGQVPQLTEILRFLPKTRQTLFFTTTSSLEIEKLSTRFLKDPVRITVSGVPLKKPYKTPSASSAAQKSKAIMNQITLRKEMAMIFSQTPVQTEINTH